MTESDERTDHQVAFVCVQNAGRSQMAAAFAERERDRRGVGDQITIVTGGTQP
ncbi:low molecular weight phosphatase family protein, partial [Halorubrum sp. E3]